MDAESIISLRKYKLLSRASVHTYDILRSKRPFILRVRHFCFETRIISSNDASIEREQHDNRFDESPSELKILSTPNA